MFWRLCQDEDALTTVEYSLLLALVALGAIGAWSGLGDPHIKGVAENAATNLPGS